MNIEKWNIHENLPNNKSLLKLYLQHQNVLKISVSLKRYLMRNFLCVNPFKNKKNDLKKKSYQTLKIANIAEYSTTKLTQQNIVPFQTLKPVMFL